MAMEDILAKAKNSIAPRRRRRDDLPTWGEMEDALKEEEKVKPIPLCAEQESAVADILGFSGISMILTGCAGSGKSQVIKYLLQQYPQDFAVCATTGKAAVIVGGVTVDSLFKFRRNKWKVVSHSAQDASMQNCPDKIIIDEASMIGEGMAGVLYDAAKNYGKTLILVGDWAQASPVKDDWPFAHPLFHQADVINLLENHRQSEGAFYDMLNRIRMGDSSPEVQYYFHTRIAPDYCEDDAVRLTGINKYALAYNEQRLQQHLHETPEVNEVRMRADIADMRPKFLRDKYPCDEKKMDQLIDNSGVADDIGLAVGCRALCTWNASSGQFVNGDTGDVVDLVYSPEKDVDGVYKRDKEGNRFPERVWSEMPDERNSFDPDDLQYVVIKLDRRLPTEMDDDLARSTVRVAKKSVEFASKMGEDRQIDYAVVGFPLKLGYALTIHKSQGMTIPKIWVDLASIELFPTMEARHGLAYVALSRVTDINGLILGSWSTRAIHCSDIVKDLVENIEISQTEAMEQ